MELLKDVVEAAWVAVVQLGIPVAVLFFIGYRIHQRDRHRHGTGGPRRCSVSRTAGQTPTGNRENRACWQVKQCPPDGRGSCPAYNNQDLPCWQVMKASPGRLKCECVGCEMFLSLPTRS